MLGFDMIYELDRWISRRLALRESTSWIEKTGRAFSICLAGRRHVCIADGVNAKAVYNSPDFHLSPVRQFTFYPAVGGDSSVATDLMLLTEAKSFDRLCLTIAPGI
jgi:hypothetical protein